jgi:VanZ like family
MPHRLIAVSAWASLAFIAYANLTRVDFVYAIYFKLSPILEHPAVRRYAFFEHFIAFAFFGAALFFAYPRRLIFVCCVVFCSAVVLEVMQTLTPDRHGTLVDASQKLAGGAFGIFVSRCIFILWDRKRHSAATPEF